MRLKRMTLTKTTILLPILLISFSCGKTDLKGEDTTTKYYEQYKSGECGSNVISDYNSLSTSCNYMSSRNDISACSQKLNSFKAKYPGISCTAESLQSGTTVTLSEAYIDSIIAQVNNL